ncbi:uncharacterized protein LOC113464826 [Ceratina calcarata]|uniref:Uncharacterized protein LOC113464826 n=1 Tax=Ceratina calcarata TaxID=156304 RepID=A0AAJ7WE26_9HYME|nr:uncharacterized protein LOC113464826 [Ceratina calcarata]
MSERSTRKLSSSRRIVEDERWMNCYFRKLASLYRKSPCLWKKDTPNYLNSERRHRAYARIHRAMDLPKVTLVEIVLKIREMRRLYVNELKTLLEAESLGRRCEISLPCFYDLHRFLYPYLDYDEAVELHNINQTFVEIREIRKSDSNIGLPASNTNSRAENILPPNAPRPLATLNSNSSPVVSLPEVKARPRTCPHSCSRITEARKQLNRFPLRCSMCTSRSSARYENSSRHHGDTTRDASMGMRQEESHKHTICELHGISSSENASDTDSDQLEAFSVSVTRCLKRLDKPCVIRAQTKIQQILERMLNRCKVMTDLSINNETVKNENACTLYFIPSCRTVHYKQTSLYKLPRVCDKASERIRGR